MIARISLDRRLVGIVALASILACQGGDAVDPTPTPSPTPLVIPPENAALVEPVLARMSSATFAAVVTRLTSIPSRHPHEPGSRETHEYLEQELRRVGWDAASEPFSAIGTLVYNVVAERRGLDDEPHIVIVCAHHDSWDGGYAGANDNAAGCAALVALAEALTLEGTRFHHTLRLVAFGAEEQGLLGSADYASRLRPEEVVGVVNLDGIAPRNTPRLRSMLFSNDQPSSEWLADYCARANSNPQVTGIDALYRYDNHTWRTDTNSFWSRGISAVWLLGNGDFPYANTLNDTLDKVDPEYGTNVARVAAAAALNLAGPLGEN